MFDEASNMENALMLQPCHISHLKVSFPNKLVVNCLADGGNILNFSDCHRIIAGKCEDRSGIIRQPIKLIFYVAVFTKGELL